MPVLRQEIFLIGYPKHQLTGCKLPSKGDCLKVLFYNMRATKLNLNQSVRLVIDECSVFWRKARIPIQESHRAANKLTNLYKEWRGLLQTKNRDTENYKNRREQWKDALNDLFDIVHKNALSLIKIEEDKQFLLKQRQKGRVGCMVGMDHAFIKKEEKRQKRQEQEEVRKKKFLETPSTSARLTMEETLSSDSSSHVTELSRSDYSENAETKEQEIGSPTKAKRARQDIVTPRLAAVLDKIKISERDAVHLLVAVLEAVGLNTADFVINRTSIRKQRETFRKAHSKKIIQKFCANTQPLAIHWDTKLLQTVTGKTEDRLAIIATAPGIEHILSMPDIPSGTGLEIASAVYDTLEGNNILDKTEAFVFDTTASNTGKFKGACTLLEKRTGRDILFLGCRHHIFEIVLAAVFTEAKLGLSTGPEIAIFKKFKNYWPRIQQNNFLTGISEPRIKEILRDDCTEILNFANNKIKEDFPRSDYKEFIELIIIFLGGTPPRGLKFSKPGAMHLARWMAKAIYCLKMLLFRHQFLELTENDIKGLIEVAGFIIKCYAFFWFNAVNAEQAPLNDLEFLRKLENYKSINRIIADKAISKILNHLYYLNEECVGFVLFDGRVNGETKSKLIKKMCLDVSEEENEEEEEEEFPKKLILKQQNLEQFITRDNSIILEELFSKQTKKLFKRFNISTDFLKKDPNTWNNLEDYRNGKYIIENLKVVNDSAESGIKLIEEFHEKVTKDEEQKQHLFKVIQTYRQQYPKTAKLQNLRNQFKI